MSEIAAPTAHVETPPTRMRDLYPDKQLFRSRLTRARQALGVTWADADFLDHLRSRYGRYGTAMHLTAEEDQRLQKLAANGPRSHRPHRQGME